MESGLTQFLTTGIPFIVRPVSSVSLPIDPKENQGKVAINILDRTADEATINTSEVVLELLLETFLTTGLLCFLVMNLD